MAELTGGCRCGGVRYAVRGEVLNVGHCHCESCRRITSSPVTTYFVVRRADVSFGGDTMRHYASSPGVRRGFCSNCGSPMSYETERRPDQVDLFVMSLDPGQPLAVREHWFWSERVDWLHIEDELPKL